MMAAPVRDLPAPDSPTTPSTSPGAIAKLTSRTATSVPRRVGNSTRSERTSSSGAASISGAFAASTDATADNGLRLVDDRRPLGLHRIAELRIDVIAQARLDIERHLLQRAREAAVPRRLHDHDVGARRDLVRNVEHGTVPHGDDARRPAIGDRAVIANAGDFTPCRAPRLATCRRERQHGGTDDLHWHLAPPNELIVLEEHRPRHSLSAISDSTHREANRRED